MQSVSQSIHTSTSEKTALDRSALDSSCAADFSDSQSPAENVAARPPRKKSKVWDQDSFLTTYLGCWVKGLPQSESCMLWDVVFCCWCGGKPLCCCVSRKGWAPFLIYCDKWFLVCFCTVTAMIPSAWQSVSSDALLVGLVLPNSSCPVYSREKSKCAEQVFRSPATQNMSPRLCHCLLVRLLFFPSSTAAELPTVRGVLWHGDYFHTSSLCRPGPTASEGDETLGQLQRSLWC